MAEKDRQLTDEEQKELLGYLVDVRDRHIRRERGIVPKHTTIVLDTDVSIPPFGITVHEGSYHMRLPEGTMPDCLTEEHEYLWTIELNGQSAIALADMVNDHLHGVDPLDRYRGEGERTELKINIDLRRVDLAEGRPLQFTELLAWIAIAEAERDGDKDRARRVFELVYKGSVPDGKAERDKELPRQDTITPRRQYDPDTKAANLMTEAAMFDESGVLLDVAGAKEHRDVNVAVSFSVDEGVELSRDISAYDREVHRAISSRWVAGNRNITAAQIASDMGIAKPKPNQIRKVEESIELQRRVFGHIDFSEEARGRRLSFPDGTPVNEFVVDGHLLEMQGITMRAANGHEVRGYQLDSAPLLYRHAAAIGQVVSYPQRWLEFGEGSATDKNMLLRSQLLRQVSRIKNPNWKKSNNIRFTTDPKHPDRPCLFSRVGINQKDRHARKNATDYVISVLDDLKKDGAIKGYTLNQQTARGGTKSTYGVTIKP